MKTGTAAAMDVLLKPFALVPSVCSQVSQVVGRGFSSLFNSYASLSSALEVGSTLSYVPSSLDYLHASLLKRDIHVYINY